MFSFFKKKSSEDSKVSIEQKEDFEDITAVAEYFHKETGIVFTQMSILKNKVSSFCKQNQIFSFTQLLQDIHSSKELKQALIDHLTTNETFFNREFAQISTLVALVKKENRAVRILSAPSSTGEEPYSIAIALLEAGIDSNNFTIVGVDINTKTIEKAREARYNQRNVRNLSDTIISKYFDKKDERYLLHQDVKSLVKFEVVNLFDENFKTIGKFDFIFSRNMLIYFDYETKLKAKKILEDLRTTDKHEVFFGHADLF